jgi:hypothetical protein
LNTVGTSVERRMSPSSLNFGDGPMIIKPRSQSLDEPFETVDGQDLAGGSA